MSWIKRGVFAINEGGRGCTVSVYWKHIYGVRVYLAGLVVWIGWPLRIRT